MLALFCVYIQHQPICLLQWLGVLLCSFAAVGINFTGGNISWKGALYLTATLIFYCMSDIYTTALTKIIQSDSSLRSAVCATAVSYAVMGLFSSLLLIRVKRSFRIMRDSVPYAFFWYGAMILLFISFSEVGVIHGTIIQATRGVISVIMGAILLKMGYEQLEPRVSVKAWIRRLVMSILMLAALTIYSYARKNM